MHSYPKIYAIGHAAIADLFKGDVLVEEKVDGSQFSFGIIDGEVSMKSRGAKVFAENAGMFSAAAEAVKLLAPILHPGWTYRGEYLQKPKHNVLAYARIPRHTVVLFDINTGEEVYLSREDKEMEAERLGLEIVPVLYRGSVYDPESLLAMLDRESILGGQKVEGVVVKNYSQFGADKKVLMGKFVSEAFKETHAKEWRASNPTMTDVVEQLIATLRHERRWEKAVERLRDAGQIEGSPRDIGNLIKAVQEDIRSEEMDFIRTKLSEWALPRIMRASSAGVAEWYKERLLRSAFEA